MAENRINKYNNEDALQLLSYKQPCTVRFSEYHSDKGATSVCVVDYFQRHKIKQICWHRGRSKKFAALFCQCRNIWRNSEKKRLITSVQINAQRSHGNKAPHDYAIRSAVTLYVFLSLHMNFMKSNSQEDKSYLQTTGARSASPQRPHIHSNTERRLTPPQLELMIFHFSDTHTGERAWYTVSLSICEGLKATPTQTRVCPKKKKKSKSVVLNRRSIHRRTKDARQTGGSGGGSVEVKRKSDETPQTGNKAKKKKTDWNWLNWEKTSQCPL